MYEVSVEAPVVTVEWVGDMSEPSILPNRLASPIVSIAGEEPAQPVLDMLMEEYENAEDEQSGTVRKTESPQKPTSPVVGETRDLFSASLPAQASLQLPGSISGKPFNAPYEVRKQTVKHPRKSWPRPRIVTETFRQPSPPSTAEDSPVGAPRSLSPILITATDARKRLQTHTAPDPAPISGVLVFGSDGSGGSEEGVESEEPEIWTTAPTSPASMISHKRRSSLLGVSPTHQGAFSPRSATRHEKGHDMGNPTTSPIRHVSFAARSSPKAVDGEAGSPLPRYRYKALFPSPTGRRERNRSTAEERVYGMRMHLRGGLAKDAKPTKRDRDRLREDNARLRVEMEALRQEFRLLREAMLASRR